MTGQKSRGGSMGVGPLGMHRHGVSGVAGKSPKLRHWLKREAEKQERRRKNMTVWKQSVRELP